MTFKILIVEADLFSGLTLADGFLEARVGFGPFMNETEKISIAKILIDLSPLTFGQ